MIRWIWNITYTGLNEIGRVRCMKYFTYFIFSVFNKYMINDDILAKKEKESFERFTIRHNNFSGMKHSCEGCFFYIDVAFFNVFNSRKEGDEKRLKWNYCTYCEKEWCGLEE